MSHLPLKGQLKTGDYACTCENCGHFFKFRSVGDVQGSISLTINGTRYDVGNEFHQATSLLEYMRSTGISKGTKGCCYEGGCGVCLVSVKLLDPTTGTQKSYAVNSCCLQLYTCDGFEITTVEGLGNTRDGLHPVQDRLAKFNGAQCGFCSPGQVMNMYGLLQRNSAPTMKEVEDAFDSTICRCTGYRAILDAMKSFAKDAPAHLKTHGGVIDIEELEGMLCKKSGKACVGHCKSKGDETDKCSNSIPKPLHIVTQLGQWLKPLSLAELYPMLKQYASSNYRLVFGNTGFGVYRDIGPWNYNVLLDIRGVQDMYNIDLTPSDHITVGANVTLTALKETLETSSDTSLPYAKTFAQHLGYVASQSIRNMATWAGNLMLKHRHNDFVSDVFTILETVGTKLSIADGDGVQTQYSLTNFLQLDMNGKVIVSMELPKYSTSDVVVRTFKTSKRLQLSDAHVSSGFNFQVDAANDYLIKAKPNIVIQGINTTLIHAVQTEGYLTNKKLADPTVLSAALNLLGGEIIPDSSVLKPSPTYRKNLALGHFYKFVLGLCKNKCASGYVSGGLNLDRPLMTGTQDYGTQDPSIFPATQPMMKNVAKNLTSGEIEYLADMSPRQGQLYAAPVLSTKGNCKIASIDATGALQIPGVVRFVQATDIPGVNDWRPHPNYDDKYTQELLSSGEVLYAGQPIGIVLAEDEVTALSARAGVKVNYSDCQPPIMSVEDAIQKKSFYEKIGPITKGDAAAAMAAAPHKVRGQVHSTDQYSFHLESQGAFCAPTDEGGMYIRATSQWLDAVSQTVSNLLGIPESSITAEAQNLGGGFGGKIFYSLPVAGLCAVAAQVSRRPVMLYMDLHTNMQYQGKRTYYVYDYEVGFDDNGKILAIIATGYSDAGALFMPADGDEFTEGWIDNVYFCPNWSWTPQPCKTHKPLSTSVRAPGSAPAIFGMESMIDHVATYLKKDHLEVRKLNLFQNGQITLADVVLEHCLIRDVVQQLETEVNYAARMQAVSDFNKNNRWKKRGFHLMPARYAMFWNKFIHTVSVSINHGDGSVVVCHGGVEMGQGIHIKVIQCCAYKLGIPMDLIRVKPSSNVTSPNSNWTAGSTTAELVCLTVMKCCDDLLAAMAPSKAKLVNPTWKEIVHQSSEDMVDLRAFGMPRIIDKYPAAHYSCWSACATEVELDVLTGQYQIVQVDYLYDTGISLNADVDMGQLEGGFVFGCGLFLLEGMKFDATTGKALTDGTWTYKVPLGKDLPIKFNAKFLRNAPNPVGLLGSKAVGEAPVASGACPLFALKRAIEAARAEVGQTGWFPLSAPATVDILQTACLTNATQYTFGN